MRGSGTAGNAWQGHSIGFSTCTPADDNAHNCRAWIARIDISAETQNVSYYALTGSTIEPFMPMVGEWHKYHIIILPDGFVEFYRDDALLLRTDTPVDLTTYTTSHLDVRGRSYNSYYFNDNLYLTGACYPLTLVHNGNGSDPVTSPANSTGCPVGHYIAEESITLFAAPDSDWHVAGWTGTDDDNSMDTTNIVTMPAAAHAVTVDYEEDSQSNILLEEDWELGIDPVIWKSYGSPLPSAYPGEGYDNSQAVDHNGDGIYDSGLIAYEAFDISNGIELEFWLRGQATTGTSHASSQIGLSTCTPIVNNETSCRDYVAQVELSAEDNAVRYYSKYGNYIESWEPINGEWHKYNIIIGSDGIISFFQDDVLKA